MSKFFSISLTLFFIMDALGIIPIYLSLVKKIPPKKQKWIALRELGFALIVMVIFHYVGEFVLDLLSVSNATLHISGGIILFLIALNMISPAENRKVVWAEGDPFIVPIAIPLIAGPSLFAAIMIFSQKEASDLLVLGAIGAAWLATAIILLLANPINRFLGNKGLEACQRLMGLILALIAVQMTLEGIQKLIRENLI